MKLGHKVVFLGDSNTGKTSIISRYLNMTDQIAPTVASSQFQMSVQLPNALIHINCWDTAGQEAYRALVPSYARGAEVAILVFDQSRTESYESLPSWLRYVDAEIGIRNIIIVSNKSDLATVVPFDKAYSFCCDQNIPLVATSAVTGNNISLLFAKVAEIIYENREFRTTITKRIDVAEADDNMRCC